MFPYSLIALVCDFKYTYWCFYGLFVSLDVTQHRISTNYEPAITVNIPQREADDQKTTS